MLGRAQRLHFLKPVFVCVDPLRAWAPELRQGFASLPVHQNEFTHIDQQFTCLVCMHHKTSGLVLEFQNSSEGNSFRSPKAQSKVSIPLHKHGITLAREMQLICFIGMPLDAKSPVVHRLQGVELLV